MVRDSWPGSTFPSRAIASDVDGVVTQVEFLVDDTVVATDTESPYETFWQTAVPGEYVVAARATDDSSAVTLSNLATILVREPVTTPFVSDDFFAAELDTSIWRFEDPVGGSDFTMDGTRLQLNVVGGPDHDLWVGGNESVRVLQTAPDIDFELESKFESVPSIAFQLQGITVQEDVDDYVRLDHFIDDAGNLRVFAATFANDNPTIRTNTIVPTPAGGELWLRLRRTVDSWQVHHSEDGANWSLITTFQHAMAVTAAGLHAGNAGVGGGPSPAFTAIADYVFETSDPIEEEDGILDDTPPVISNLSAVPSGVGGTISFMTDELALGRVEYGLTPALELGVVAPTIFRTDQLDHLRGHRTRHGKSSTT